MDRGERYRGCLLGLATGDALGAPVEGAPRGSFRPLTDMVGAGPYGLPRGTWTDDTSLALCLGESLVEQGGFDPADQMCRYLRWLDDGYMSCASAAFGIGSTTRSALEAFRETGDPFSGPTDPQTAGNGSIMRYAPLALYYFPDRELIQHYSADSSRTTHGAEECVDACRLLGDVLFRALSGGTKDEMLFGKVPDLVGSPTMCEMARGDYAAKSADEIRGSGYVVESLEAALWCFHRTETFRDAVLEAVNLGNDTDTTGAICGQIAGAFYGESGIPPEWLGRLEKREMVDSLAERLLLRAGRSG